MASAIFRSFDKRGILRWPPSLPVDASQRSNAPCGTSVSSRRSRKIPPARFAS